LRPRYANILQPQRRKIQNKILLAQPLLPNLHSFQKAKAMAAAQGSEAKSKGPNLCEPQPTVTIYISKNGSDASEKVTREPLSGQASTNGTHATHSTPSPQPQKFIIHKNKICSHSSFFSAAFNSNFIEGMNQAMKDLLNMSLQGKPTIKEFLHCCHIADQHAAGESRLTLFAAAVLTWTPDGFLDDFLPLIPISVFVKAWQAMKKEQNDRYQSVCARSGWK
jgi:hypothetical protein